MASRWGTQEGSGVTQHLRVGSTTLPEDVSTASLRHNNGPLCPQTTDIHAVRGSELKAADGFPFILRRPPVPAPGRSVTGIIGIITGTFPKFIFSRTTLTDVH